MRSIKFGDGEYGHYTAYSGGLATQADWPVPLCQHHKQCRVYYYIIIFLRPLAHGLQAKIL